MDLVGRDIYGHRERPFCHLQGAMPPFLCGSDSEDSVPGQKGRKAGGKPSLQSARPTLLELETICGNTKGGIREREAGAAKKGKK